MIFHIKDEGSFYLPFSSYLYQSFRRTKLIVNNSKIVFQTANAHASDRFQVCKTV